MKTEGHLPRRSRLAQGQGAADFKADASAADLPLNRKAAELYALEGPFKGRMHAVESILGSLGVRFGTF